MWKSLFWWMFFVCTCAAQHTFVEIVSIIDHLSAPACLLKIHSIIESSADKSSLSFKFLIMPSLELSVQEWDLTLSLCFPKMRFESKAWKRPLRLVKLSETNFEKDVIFARFYLADIFSSLKKFIYLDNDIVVTADLYNVFNQRLIQLEAIPSGDDTTHTTVAGNPRHAGRGVQHPHAVAKPVGPPATVGFVYETHPGYRAYLHAHFNMSHPFVKAAIDNSGSDAFLNGGVFIVDAVRWRQKKYTERVEDFILQNAEEHMYNTAAVGDQGPFLLLFQNDTAYLPPKYNMRRLPKKTVNLLSDTHITGVVHFAGTTRGDAELLCREPTKYPIYLTGAMPLYLSVAHSFNKKHAQCPLRVGNGSCSSAVGVLQEELTRLNLEVKYNPGLGNFRWPPV